MVVCFYETVISSCALRIVRISHVNLKHYWWKIKRKNELVGLYPNTHVEPYKVVTEETTDLSLCQRPRGNRTRRWCMVHVLVRLQGTPRCKVNTTFGKLKLDLYYFSIICANMFCSTPGKRTPFIILIVHIISPMLFSLLSIRSPNNVDFHTLYAGYSMYKMGVYITSVWVFLWITDLPW